MLHQPLKVGPIERHGAVHKGVQENPQGPAVNLRPPVRATSHYLRGGVERGAAEGAEEVRVVEHVGQPEVCYLGAAVLVQQNVLQLEVSVADVVLQIVKCQHINNI